MLINVTESLISSSAQAGSVWLSPSLRAGGHTSLALEGGTAGGAPSLEQRPQPLCWGESWVIPTFQEQQSGVANRTPLDLHGMRGVYWCSMAVLGEPCHEPHQWLSLPSGLTHILATIPCPPPRPVPHPNSISCLSKDQAGQQVSVPVTWAGELGFVLLILMVKHRNSSV